MKHFIFLHIKSFLLFTIVGMIHQSISILMMNSAFDIHDFIILSILTGLLIASILGFIHWFRLRRMKLEKISATDISVIQNRRFETTLDESEVLKKLNDANIKFHVIPNGEFIIKTNNIFGWFKTTLKITKGINEPSIVYINSKPIIRTTIIDFGENLRIVKTMENILSLR